MTNIDISPLALFLSATWNYIISMIMNPLLWILAIILFYAVIWKHWKLLVIGIVLTIMLIAFNINLNNIVNVSTIINVFNVTAH